MILRRVNIFVIVLSLAICAVGWAEEEATDTTAAAAEKPAEPKVKGLDMVTDVVGDVGNKAVALVSGNLSVEMEPGKDKTMNKNDYTYNALGQRVPKKTATKTGGALHN